MAERVDVDRNTVSRWETGRNRPQPYHLQRICGTFAVSPEVLGFVESESEDEVRRRQLMKGLVGLGLMGALGPLTLDQDRLLVPADLSSPGRCDETVLDDLEAMTRDLAQRSRRVSPAMVVDGAFVWA